MTDWLGRAEQLAALAQKTLFFIGGAPRSGTTWLQQMLDAHPQIACRGEGLFLNNLTVPLETMMAERATVIERKNKQLFTHTGGFPLPDQAVREHLVGTAILLALAQYEAPEHCRALGEKTPENVFHFPRLRVLFPNARFIAIAREPRDVLSSAWHFFGKPQGQEMENFVHAALPSLKAGAEAMIQFATAYPGQTRLVSYEALRTRPDAELAALFTLLDVSTDPALIADIVAATSFAAVTGRTPGDTKDGIFHRSGTVGSGRATFSPDLNAAILSAMGWMFPRFGWVA